MDIDRFRADFVHSVCPSIPFDPSIVHSIPFHSIPFHSIPWEWSSIPFLLVSIRSIIDPQHLDLHLVAGVNGLQRLIHGKCQRSRRWDQPSTPGSQFGKGAKIGQARDRCRQTLLSACSASHAIPRIGEQALAAQGHALWLSESMRMTCTSTSAHRRAHRAVVDVAEADPLTWEQTVHAADVDKGAERSYYAPCRSRHRPPPASEEFRAVQSDDALASICDITSRRRFVHSMTFNRMTWLMRLEFSTPRGAGPHRLRHVDDMRCRYEAALVIELDGESPPR